MTVAVTDAVPEDESVSDVEEKESVATAGVHTPLKQMFPAVHSPLVLHEPLGNVCDDVGFIERAATPPAAATPAMRITAIAFPDAMDKKRL